MALFGKKTVVCALCGKEAKTGLLRGLFQREIEGQYVCDDCYDNVDLPTSFTIRMTLDQFRAYRAFQAENQKLKDDFRITYEVDFGVLETKFYFDTVHNRMCMDKQLKKTIFQGKDICSFVIREDDFEIFRGSSSGLISSESTVRQKVMLMDPMVRTYRMQLQRYEDRLNSASAELTGNMQDQKPVPRFDTHPFHRFYVEIHLDHPYWNTITAELSAPEFSPSQPNTRDYLNSYDQRYRTVQHLAHSLISIMGKG